MADDVAKIEIAIRQGNVDVVKGEQLEVTLRGDPTAIVDTLVNGLSRENLLLVHEALGDELAARGLPAIPIPGLYE